MVVRGRARDGDRILGIGDWSAWGAGSHHLPLAYETEDCWFIVRVEGEGVRMRGWRGMLQRGAALLPRRLSDA